MKKTGKLTALLLSAAMLAAAVPAVSATDVVEVLTLENVVAEEPEIYETEHPQATSDTEVSATDKPDVTSDPEASETEQPQATSTPDVEEDVDIIVMDKCGDELIWELDEEGNLTISGNGAMWDWKSTTERPWHEYREDIKTIVVEEGVTDIGFSAFSGFINLTSVTLPQGLTEINAVAFHSCASLTDINLPESLTTLDAQAFEGCTSLTGITLPENLETISSYVFRNCTSLNNVVIPKSVTQIKAGAFYGCTNLENMTVYATYITLGSDILAEGCKWLVVKGVKGSDMREYVKENGFLYIVINYKLTYNYNTGTIPSETVIMEEGTGADMSLRAERLGYKQIGWNTDPDAASALSFCTITDDTVLYAVWVKETPETGTVGGTLTATASWEMSGTTLTIKGTGYIPDFCADSILIWVENQPWYEYAKQVETVIIEEGITNIPGIAFNKCSSLKSITIPSTVTKIGHRAFNNCVSLKDIQLPEGLREIGSNAFINCSTLSDINIPKSMEIIGSHAFYECKGITGLNLPEGLREIGDQAFQNCYGIDEVTIPSTVEKIGANAFSGTNIKSLEILSNKVKIGNYAFSGTDITEVIVPEGVTLGDGVFMNCRSLTSTQINTTSCNDADYLFSGCYSLTDVTLPEGIEYVAVGMFYECAKLKEIELPQSVEVISQEAFYGCSQLGKINMPPLLRGVSNSAFDGCRNLTFDALPENLAFVGRRAFAQVKFIADTIEIPKTLTEIGAYAFTQATFNSELILHNTITKVDENAFNSTSISKAVFNGSLAEWRELNGYANDNITRVMIFTNVSQGQCGENAYWSISPDTTTLTISGEGAMYSYGEADTTAYAFTMPWHIIAADRIKKIIVEEGITSTGEYSFAALSALKEVELPSTLVTLGAYTFYNDTLLETINLEGVNYTGDYAFWGCKSLEKAHLSLNSGEYVFGECISLKRATLAEGITEINDGVFYNCVKLAGLNIPDTVTKLGDYAFSGCIGMIRMDVGKSVTDIAPTAFEESWIEIRCSADSAIRRYAQETGQKFRIIDGALLEVTAQYSPDVEVWTENSVMTVSAASAEGNSIVLYTADYDENGRLVSLKSETAVVEDGKAEFAVNEGATVMLWNTDGSPIIQKTEI